MESARPVADHVQSEPLVRQLSPANKQQNAFRLDAAKKKYITERLKNNFPNRYAFLFTIFMTALGLIAIYLQILMIVFKSAYWVFCQGIWGGSVCIGVAIINFFLIRNKSFAKFNSAFLMILIGASIIFISMVFFPILVIQRSLYNDESNSKLLGEQTNFSLVALMLAVGVVSALTSIKYPLLLQMYLMRGFDRNAVLNQRSGRRREACSQSPMNFDWSAAPPSYSELESPLNSPPPPPPFQESALTLEQSAQNEDMNSLCSQDQDKSERNLLN